MRDLKFRAWDKKNKVFLKPTEILIRAFNGRLLNWNKNLIFDVVLQQYTGLKDKNGKEIYFEDFVSIDKEVFVVKWNTYKISLINISYGDILDLREDIASRSIIKSNVYENSFKFTPKYTKIS